jgi:proteasome lid subunit RPN8/RPN11
VTTTAREVCLLIGRGGAILWADASTSPSALPDSRARWEAIWSHRDELEVIAHSHPLGPAAFSAEDLSTMAALDAALGKPLCFMVVAPRVTIARTGEVTHTVSPEPWWTGLLRLASGITKED